MNDDERALIDRFWAYRASAFHGADDLFDEVRHTRTRPPVFRREYAEPNVFVDPDASATDHARVRATLDERRRHRWFGSMRSSQALTQSVFGNLGVVGRLHRLANLPADDHEIAFFVDEQGRVQSSHHAVLLYDDRNPAFRTDGAGLKAYDAIKRALRQPAMLRRCSWQRLVGRLAEDPTLGWLVEALRAKYGLVGRPTGVPEA